ncbi:hypothetical protein ACFU5Z_31115 [Streptomyces sp. NPDC057521]|uniref:hypothetical protein n=1 Tax=Streptomyces sp. NPDC057521 TaxID=3346156 RepID=UPI00368E6602
MAHAPRVYGSDGEAGSEPEPGHDYRELVGGPLDGQLLDVTGWSENMLTTGAYLITPLSPYGPGGRADYAPAPGAPEGPSSGNSTSPNRCSGLTAMLSSLG